MGPRGPARTGCVRPRTECAHGEGVCPLASGLAPMPAGTLDAATPRLRTQEPRALLRSTFWFRVSRPRAALPCFALTLLQLRVADVAATRHRRIVAHSNNLGRQRVRKASLAAPCVASRGRLSRVAGLGRSAACSAQLAATRAARAGTRMLAWRRACNIHISLFWGVRGPISSRAQWGALRRQSVCARLGPSVHAGRVLHAGQEADRHAPAATNSRKPSARPSTQIRVTMAPALGKAAPAAGDLDRESRDSAAGLDELRAVSRSFPASPAATGSRKARRVSFQESSCGPQAGPACSSPPARGARSAATLRRVRTVRRCFERQRSACCSASAGQRAGLPRRAAEPVLPRVLLRKSG